MLTLLLAILLVQDDPPVKVEPSVPEPAAAVVFRIKGLDMPLVYSFSPDGKRLAVGGGSISTCFATKQTAEIWDVPGRKRLVEFRVGVPQVVSMEWSPDATTLLLSGGGPMGPERCILVYDAASGKERAGFSGHHGNPTMAKFSRDGTKILSCGMDGQAFLWDIATGKLLRSIENDRRKLDDIHFLPDGKTVQVLSGNGTLLDFDLAGGELRRSEVFGGGASWCTFSPDASTLTLVRDKDLVEVWDPFRRALVASIKVSTEFYPRARASADGRLLAVALDEALEIWEVASQRRILTLKHVQLAGFFSPDGMLLATGFDFGSMVLWDLRVLLASGPAPADPWADLGSPDPAVGFRAAFDYISRGDEGAAALADRAFALPSPEQIAALIARLDDDNASVREAARKEAGIAFRPALRRALGAKPGEQLRRTLEEVLRQLDGPTPKVPDAIRLTRMAYALEHIGTPAAREVLVRLADAGISSAEDGRLRLAIERMKRK